MSNSLKGLLRLFIPLCAILLSPYILGAEKSIHSIKSGCEFEYPPFTYQKDGKAVGFSVDLLREAAGSMGIKVNYVVDSWVRLKKKLKDGEIQALPIMVRNSQREKYYEFTFPYLAIHGAIIVRTGDTRIKNMKDLAGKKVAVINGGALHELLERSNSGAIITPTRISEEALRLLQSGAQDAVVMQQVTFAHMVSKHKLRGVEVVNGSIERLSQQYCFAVKKGNSQLLSRLNEGLSVVIANGTFRSLQKKWFTDLDQLYETKVRLVVGGDWDFPPYEFLDKDGNPAGFNVDLTKAIARKMGLRVDIRLKRWSKIRKELKEERINVIEGMFYSPHRSSEFLFSPAHSILNHVSVVRQGRKVPNNVKDLSALSLVVMDGDIMHDWALEKGLDKHLHTVGTQEEALRKVSVGTYDCALVAQIPAYYWISRLSLKNLSVGTTSLLSGEYCYAVSNGHFPLINKFTDGLAALKKTGEYRKIRDKWLAPYENNGLYNRISKYALFVLLPLLALLLILGLWGYTLKKRIRVISKNIADTERRWRYALESAGGGLWEYNIADQTVFFSSRFKDILGYSDDEFHDTLYEWRRHIHPGDLETVNEKLRQCLEGVVDVFDCTYRIRSKDGDYKWVVGRGRVFKSYTGDEQSKILGTSTDITALMSAREALRESRKRLEIAAAVGGFGVWEHNLKTGMITFDEKINEIYGGDLESGSVTLSKWEEYLHPEDHDQVVKEYYRAIEFNELFDCEFRILNSDGALRYIQGIGMVMEHSQANDKRVVGINRDITRDKEMDQKIRQMEKMNSIGQLAGGLAHDFNNQLAGIMGFCELLMTSSVTQEDKQYFDGILSGVRHLSSLTQQLLAFARKGQYRVEHVSIHEIIDGLQKIVLHSFDKRILVKKQYDAYSDAVNGDSSQIHNALLNILLNSRDAMPSGGKIILRTSNVTFDYEHAQEIAPSLKGGEYLKVEIADSGEGIKPEAMKHVFEPFYTTKDVGKGIGMGLPAVLGTLQNHGGHVDIQSVEDEGTTVTLYFPVCKGGLLHDVIDTASGVFYGRKIFLIDSQTVDNYLCSLRPAHWTDLENNDDVIEKVVSFFKSRCSLIDIVIIDFDLPLDRGESIFRRVCEINCNAKIIIAGFAKTDKIETYLQKGAYAFMYKPLLQDDLKKVIESLKDNEYEQWQSEDTADDQNEERGRILVIDDEQAIRKSLKATLGREHYEVVEASSGLNGVERFKEEGGEFLLTILDYVMPDMNGEQVFHQLREYKPDCRILLISGYSHEEISEELINSPYVWFLQKPYVRDELTQLLRDIACV